MNCLQRFRFPKVLLNISGSNMECRYWLDKSGSDLDLSDGKDTANMEEVKYYRHLVGEVIIRQRGDLIEKKKKGQEWTEAPQLRRRIQYGDTELIEITEEEAMKLAGD